MKIKNKAGQQVMFELPNGEPANLNQYAKDLLSSQDFAQWKTEPEAFKVWFATCLADFIKRTTPVFTLPKSA